MKIVKPDATQDQVDEVVASGGDSAIFANQILDAGHSAAVNALADVQQRHLDILRLEESIVQLHQLFVDLAVLVETQGEEIDLIEKNIEKSVTYTRKGVEKLQSAIRKQRQGRKKYFIIGALVIFIGGGVLAGVFLYLALITAAVVI